MTEEMLSAVAREAIGTDQVSSASTEISLAPPYRRVSLREGARAAAAAKLGTARRPTRTCATARPPPPSRGELDVEMQPAWGAGKIATEIFERLNEDDLVQPTFVYDFPTEVSPLSKQKPDDPDTVERFELYIGGFEVANAFSELNDPAEQRRRFEAQLADRAAGDHEAHAMDEDYIRALEYGLPPTGGRRRRHRSAGDAADRQPVDPRRHPVPADAARKTDAKLTRADMDLPFELFIALRYLLARRKQAFISLISLISVLGVAVGVMALLIALALMTGCRASCAIASSARRRTSTS